MSAPQIGIYLADHTFYPVFTDDRPGKKRILLSTSHPRQECVDVVLIRRDPDFPAGEQRLGNVLLCDITAAEPSSSEIEVILELHANGRIDASARDRRSGNTRDVSFDPDEAVPRQEGPDAFDEFAAGGVDSLLDEQKQEARDTSGRKRLLLVVLVILLLGALGFALVRFGLPGGGGAELEDSSDRVEAPESTDRSGDTDSAAAPAPSNSGDDGNSPAESAGDTGESVPVPTDGDGVPYQIKWGDTLWDLSRMFYGTPWRFPEIADENDISDPDRIYANDRIQIPRK